MTVIYGFIVHEMIFYVLRKTELTAANSIAELIGRGFKRHLKGKKEMKTLLSLLGGALVLTETSGVVTLSFDESLGGGAAAGILQGKGSLIVQGTQGLQLAEKLLNSHLSAGVQPLAVAAETVVNEAAAAIE